MLGSLDLPARSECKGRALISAPRPPTKPGSPRAVQATFSLEHWKGAICGALPTSPGGLFLVLWPCRSNRQNILPSVEPLAASA